MKYFHRVVFYSLLVSSLVWACFALKTNPFSLLYNFEFIESVKFIYILGGTAVFWPIFYVEIMDYLISSFGRNGKLYKTYANSIKKDIVVSFVAALILGSIYWLDLVKYNFSGIDLGYVGFPFLIYSIYTLFQIMKIKVAGKPVRKLPIIVMFVVIAIFTILAYSTLVKNSSGEYEAYQAIWFQLTILFASFFIFTSVSFQKHSLEKGKVELSQFKKYFFSQVIRSKNRLYESLEEPLIKMNEKTLQEKAKYSSSLRKKGKK
ncbi:hypothetical protein [Marinomonas lutimaris]|uniref:hypothetical protein n=1 Tax=Marinomonas lutimaris TaxID=2846746 RepID=UPI001CA5D40B|nr:hypothetical protein [Marinomonas lutimaris]